MANSAAPNDPPEWAREFLRSVQAIEAHTQATATLIPQQTNELNKTVAQVYQGAGASTAKPGPASTSGERSDSSSLKDDNTPGWRARTTLTESADQGLAPWLHLPGAHPTPVDYFQMLSVSSANLAKNHADKSRERAIDKLADQYGGRDAIPAAKLAEAQEAEYSGGRWGTASNVFASGKTGYIQGRVVSSMVRDMLQPFNDARKFGYETGYSGSAQPGFLGIRMPWDAPALAGIGQKLSQTGFAFNNDVTPGQASTIYNNLFGQGWMGGSATDAMRTASAQMMRQNPYIASMPQYYSMMDQATRLGAASLQEFNSVMFGVADAAKAAHTTLPQTIADMDQLGQLNKQRGGTYMGGLENAQQWQSITGQPASTMVPALQNGLVQGQTFLRTGLIAPAQGLATPEQNIQSIMGALNMMNSIIVPPGDLSIPIGNTGFSTKVSSQDYKESIIASQTGWSKALVHSMIANSKGILAGARVGGEARAYKSQVAADVAAGNQDAHAVGDLANIERGSGAGTWKQVQSDLSAATDQQGRHIFENWKLYDKLRKEKSPTVTKNPGRRKYTDQQAQAMAIADATQSIDQAGDDQFLKDVGAWSGKGDGMTKDQRHELVNRMVAQGNVPGKALFNRAFNRNWQAQQTQRAFTNRFTSTSTDDNTGPKLTIELGKGAKQLFRLADPSAVSKGDANAGRATIALSTNGSATTAPFPTFP